MLKMHSGNNIDIFYHFKQPPLKLSPQIPIRGTFVTLVALLQIDSQSLVLLSVGHLAHRSESDVTASFQQEYSVAEVDEHRTLILRRNNGSFPSICCSACRNYSSKVSFLSVNTRF